VVIFDFALDHLIWTSGGVVSFEMDAGSPYMFRASAPGWDSGRAWMNNDGIGGVSCTTFYNSYRSRQLLGQRMPGSRISGTSPMINRLPAAPPRSQFCCVVPLSVASR
jgi:hypothetical protein